MCILLLLALMSMTACSSSSESDRPEVAYGEWPSPLTAARVTAGSLRFGTIVIDGEDVYWVEGRASESGRNVIVRRTPDGMTSDVTPAGFNVRTRVHEYGGAAFTVIDGTVYFSNFADQRLYRQPPAGEPVAITPEGYFFAECRVDGSRERLLCVREDHTAGDAEPVNTIVSVPASGDGVSAGTVLVSGADFYSNPVLSPDGTAMAWLEWRHPNMPWDGTELWVADVDARGTLGRKTRVAGAADATDATDAVDVADAADAADATDAADGTDAGQESIFQPSWSPDGTLYFVSDRTGWWNLYRRAAAGIEAVHPMEAEFGTPQWTFGMSTYAFITPTRLAAAYTQNGRWHLALVDVDAGTFQPLDLTVPPLAEVRATTRAVYFIGASPTSAPAITKMSLGTTEAETIRPASEDPIDPAWVSVPEAVTFPSTGGDPVHAFHYAPHNPDVSAVAETRPPLLVVSHGGPTGASEAVLDPRIQFWTSRGFAVLDVNYGGSTGYGRAYRDRLKGKWGEVDVADVVNGAKYMAARGLADEARLAIRGGSAGGYTTLAALTFYDVFKAGASYYGISDIEVLARDTHKFESRYLDSLIGPYPEAKDLYVARSPIHFTDRLSSALILFQGLEDRVVPPNQSEMMAEALRKKGLPVAYLTFEGEQHGFRQAKNIVRSLEAELYFYGAVFGFTPADRIDPVPIDNLSR